MSSAVVYFLMVFLPSTHICIINADTSNKGDRGDVATSDSVSSSGSKDLVAEATHWKGTRVVFPPPETNEEWPPKTKYPQPHGNHKGWVGVPFTSPPNGNNKGWTRITRSPKPPGTDKGTDHITFTFPPPGNNKGGPPTTRSPKPRGTDKGTGHITFPPSGNNKGGPRTTRSPKKSGGNEEKYSIEALMAMLDLVLREIRRIMVH